MGRNKQFFDIIFVSLQSNCFFAKDLGLKRTLIIYDQHRQIVENQKDKVATIGFFDGVHRGHCCLIHQVIEEAKKRGLKSVLLTFPEHPAKVLRPDVEMKLLTIQEEKEELLATSGADFVAFLPFTRELAQLSAHEFMQQVLKEQLQVKVLVIAMRDSRIMCAMARNWALKWCKRRNWIVASMSVHPPFVRLWRKGMWLLLRTIWAILISWRAKWWRRSTSVGRLVSPQQTSMSAMIS